MGLSYSKKRLIFIRQHYTPFGGAERYLERLNGVLKSKNFDTDIIHSKLPKWLPSWLRVFYFNKEVCNRRSKDQEVIYFSLDRITCPDIYRAGDGVHRAFLKTKAFSLNPLHLILLWLERQTFNNAKLIIANSKLVKEQILKYYPATQENKIHIVYNGIPLPKEINKKKAKERLANSFGFDPSLPLILFVGSGFKRKGVEEFLELISKLQVPYYALIVGKEKHMAYYKNIAKKLNISKHLTFTGARSDIEQFYEGADIFIFPTHYEPFSNVILEALSYGVVSFTTKQNGASEILTNRWIMTNPKDYSILEELERLLTNKDLLNKASKNAKEIAKMYPIERNVQETLDLIYRYFR